MNKMGDREKRRIMDAVQAAVSKVVSTGNFTVRDADLTYGDAKVMVTVSYDDGHGFRASYLKMVAGSVNDDAAVMARNLASYIGAMLKSRASRDFSGLTISNVEWLLASDARYDGCTFTSNMANFVYGSGHYQRCSFVGATFGSINSHTEGYDGGIEFSDCDMRDATVTLSHLGSRYIRCKMQGFSAPSWSGIKLIQCDFRGFVGSLEMRSYARYWPFVEHCDFTGADLTNSDFRGSRQQANIFTGANITNVRGLVDVRDLNDKVAFYAFWTGDDVAYEYGTLEASEARVRLAIDLTHANNADARDAWHRALDTIRDDFDTFMKRWNVGRYAAR